MSDDLDRRAALVFTLLSATVQDGDYVRAELSWQSVLSTPVGALLMIDGCVYKVADRSVAPHDDRGYLWLSPMVAEEPER